MKITMNKDFEESFPNEFYSGFTFGQCLAAAVGLLFSIGIAWVLWKTMGIPVVECTYIAIPFMIPFLAVGFFKYQKHNLKGITEAMNYYRKTKKLLYEAEEYKGGKERVLLLRRKIPDRNRKRKKPGRKNQRVKGGMSHGSHKCVCKISY